MNEQRHGSGFTHIYKDDDKRQYILCDVHVKWNKDRFVKHARFMSCLFLSAANTEGGGY